MGSRGPAREAGHRAGPRSRPLLGRRVLQEELTAASQSVMSGARRRGGPGAEPLDAKAARVAAFDLLARKAWSRRDLAARLRRRGAAPEVAAAVVAELEGKGY